MKKKILSILFLSCLLSSCSNNDPSNFEEHVNINKPVVFYGTPVLKTTELNSSYQITYDDDALSFNDKTIYVGLDYEELASLQADMIYNYIEANRDKINRLQNADGKEATEDDHILRYILVADNNTSFFTKMQIRAIRQRLGTLKKDSNGNEILTVGASNENLTVTGSLSFQDKQFTIVENNSFDMSTTTYSASYITRDTFSELEKGTSFLDFVITVNDSLSWDIYNVWGKSNKVPVFGFGGSETALEAMSDNAEVPYAGTVYVNQSYLAYLKFRTMINLLDDRSDFYEYGITKADSNGSVLKNPELVRYDTSSNSKKLLLRGKIVNRDTASSYINYKERENYDDTLKPLSTSHTVWYNRALTSSDEKNDFEYGYDEKYKDMLKLTTNSYDTGEDSITYQTQSDKYYLSKFKNLNDYEGYIINLCNPVNGIEYTSVLKQ